MNSGDSAARILGVMFDEVKTLLQMLADRLCGRYPSLPWYCIAAVGFTLLYALCPLDMVPDWIPLAGMLDDAALIYLCLKLLGPEIARYRQLRLSSGTAAGRDGQ